MNSTSTIHPRRSDCPGSFHSRQSSGTSFKMYPYYGKHFTQSPSLQPRLFLNCNPICLIFKVLLQDGFLFVRSSGCSPLLIRSRLLYNAQNHCSVKIVYQICQGLTDRLSRSFTSRRLPLALARGFHSQAKKLAPNFGSEHEL